MGQKSVQHGDVTSGVGSIPVNELFSNNLGADHNPSSKVMGCDCGLGIQSPVSKEKLGDVIRSKVEMGLSVGPEIESHYTSSKGHRKIKALWSFHSTKLGRPNGAIKRKRNSRAICSKGSTRSMSKRKATDVKQQVSTQIQH
ncbi:hypothetical protein Ancab_029375 [Ancistrocladus abbreviatus]